MNYSKPTFIGIGTQKAATTWLYQSLSDMPSVWMPPIKEFFYFDLFRNGSANKYALREQHSPEALIKRYKTAQRKRVLRSLRGLSTDASKYYHDVSFALKYLNPISFNKYNDEWYSSLFPKNLISGEVTTTYCLLERSLIRSLFTSFPELKIIFTVRNPIDRCWSAFNNGFLKGQIDNNCRNVSDELHQLIVQRAEMLGTRMLSDYATITENWLSAFPRSQFKLIFFDQIVDDEQAITRDLAEFLGVKLPENFVPLKRGKIKTSGATYTPARIRKDLARIFYHDTKRFAKMVGGIALDWEREMSELSSN